jgi:hypothetical protein
LHLGILYFWFMQILFAISILCFLALAWAGIAVTRHISAGRKRSRRLSPAQHNFAQHLFRAAEEASLPEPRIFPNQNIRDITARKSWNQPPEVVTVHPSPGIRSDLIQNATEPIQGKRKAPQSSHQSGMERLDWAYFNKDLGDLTDPYQTPRIRANSRTSPRRY